METTPSLSCSNKCVFVGGMELIQSVLLGVGKWIHQMSSLKVH